MEAQMISIKQKTYALQGAEVIKIVGTPDRR